MKLSSGDVTAQHWDDLCVPRYVEDLENQDTYLSCPASPSCRPLLGLPSKFRWLVVMVTTESEGYLHCSCFHP